MVSVVIRAVHKHAAMLAASIMSPGNDLRLGGNEAPPTIISIFLGSMLETIFSSIGKGEAARATEAQIIELGVSHIPDVAKDYTDRNRTSPVAFTGNKFEFRAVGSSANTAVPVSILNAAIADAFSEARSRLSTLLTKGGSRDEAVMALIKEMTNENSSILFSGNNYSQEWRDEAKRRGLPIIDSAADAFNVWSDEKKTQFLISSKVLTRDELQARYLIGMERYVKTLEIELETTAELVTEFIVPAVEKQLLQTNAVLASTRGDALKNALNQRANVNEKTLADLLTHTESLRASLHKIDDVSDESQKVLHIVRECKPVCQKLRKAADTAEMIVASDLWTLPKYRDLLFHPSLR